LAEVWPNILYSFCDNGQILGFSRIVQSDLWPSLVWSTLQDQYWCLCSGLDKKLKN